MLVNLRTDKLILRPFVGTDASALFMYASDPRVTAYTAWARHPTIRTSRFFIDKITHTKRLLWAVECVATQELIGECGLTTSTPETAEIACALAPQWWGKGLAFQALEILIQWCFTNQPYTAIHASIISHHPRSHTLALHLGMTQTAVLTQQWYANNTAHDIALYALTRTEWLTYRTRNPIDTACHLFPLVPYVEYGALDKDSNSL